MNLKNFRHPALWVGLFLLLGRNVPAGQLPGTASEAEAKEVRQIFGQWSDCLKQGQKECVLSWMWNSPELQVITAQAEVIRGWQGFSKKLEQMIAQPDVEYKVESATPLGPDHISLLYSVLPVKEKSPLKKLLGSMSWVKKQEGWRCTQLHLVQSLDGKPLLPAIPSLEDLELPTLPTLPNLPTSSALTPGAKKTDGRKAPKTKAGSNLEDPDTVPSTTLPGTTL
jgi:hypothetical protein